MPLSTSLSVFLLAILVALAPAAEPIQLRLDLPDDRTMVLLLTGTEPVIVCGGWLQHGSSDNDPVALLVDGLTVSGREISGQVEENIPGKRRRDPLRWSVQLNVGSGTVSGTFSGKGGKGSVSGRVLDLASLRQAEGIDPRCNWPAWRGNGCGVATFDKGQQLLEDPRQARFVWLSEPLPLPGHTPDHGTVGGYGSFCNWEGKLFLLYYEGSGEEPWKGGRSIDEHWAGLKDKQQDNLLASFGSKENWAKAKLSVLADDVLVCIDAASGLRLWERRFENKGFNWADISGAHFHPCTDGERVYAVGSSGRIYAVDIDTGEPVWETVIPGMDPDGGRDRALAQARVGTGRKNKPLGRYEPFRHCYDINSKPRIIGGVLVLGERGLVGIDPATGQLRWGPLQEVNTGNAFTWTHQGKELIISSVRYGRATGPGWSASIPPTVGSSGRTTTSYPRWRRC